MPSLVIDIAGVPSTKDRYASVLLIRLGTGLASIRRPLCRVCDPQTPIRATLRALVGAACFAHEICKLGSRDAKDAALCDVRPLAGKLVVIIRTTCDFAANFATGHPHQAHADLADTFESVRECLRNAGAGWKIVRVGRADYYSQRAERLGENESIGFAARCETCDVAFEKQGRGLVEHFKTRHMGRDLVDEGIRGRGCSKAAGMWSCALCGAGCLGRAVLDEHLRNVHGR